MGDLSGVSSLVKGPVVSAYDWLRGEVDALFMRNDNAGVCSFSRPIGQVERPLAKAFIFVSPWRVNDKAALGASLLRETGDNDKIFNGLLEQLRSGCIQVASRRT